MTKLKSVGLAIALCFFATGESRADLILSLSSTTPDLTQIQIGDTVQSNVALSGLNAVSDTLDFLAADVKFEASLFGTPVTLTPGPILVDLTGVSSGTSPGLANLNYDDLFATTNAPILTNGLFFSFTVVAQAEGSGTVFFNFTDASLNGAGATPTPMNTLSFTIQPVRIVPEPSAFLLCVIGAGATWAIRRVGFA